MGIYDWLRRKQEKAEEEHYVEKMPNNKDVEALIRALKHEDTEVKKQAVKVLGELGNPRAIEPLIQALNDWDLHERDVADSLAMIGEPAVESLLLAMEEPETKWGAITALGDIGDARAIYPLVKASRDVDPKIRGAAVIALGKIGDGRVVQPLIGFLNVEEGVVIRQFAIEALGDIGDSRAIASLTQASKDEDASIRKYAEEALKKTKSKQFGKKEKAKSGTEAIKTKIRALLQDLPVIEKEDISEYRQRIINYFTPPHPCMFSGSMGEATEFVTKMVQETESYILSCEGIIWVEKGFLISSLPISHVLEIQYEQLWDDGSSAIYSENVMRVGEDQFEVFGSPKSAARMKKKGKGSTPS